MNKKWITLLFSFSLCFCMSCSDSESDKKEEGKVEEEKPVTVLSKTVPLADPYILVHDSLYYIYGTNVGTGFDVYYSKDLEYWERASALSLSHANSYGESMFWAPEVYYVEKDKKFYMFYSTEEHICVATADSPLGPFKQDEHKPIREEKSIECFKAEEPWELVLPKVVEGPSVFKQNGVYYLIYSANGYTSQDYAVGFATSDSPFGPWKKYEGNPVLHKCDGLVGVGHGAPFVDMEGKMRYVFHAHKSESEIHPRNSFVVDMFVKDSIVSLGGNIVRPMVVDRLPSGK